MHLRECRTWSLLDLVRVRGDRARSKKFDDTTRAVISCGGVVVRPGDAIIGDDDGVVVVPAAMADRVLEIAAEREEVEQVIKKELRKNPGSPGKYYPFNDATWKLFDEYKSRGEA